MLAPLPKKGDLHNLMNSCSVSLVSMDYKVIAKAISRMKSMLADVINPNQTYIVPGHTMFDNLYLAWDLLHLACRAGLPLALLALDWEKAFGSVDFRYLV